MELNNKIARDLTKYHSLYYRDFFWRYTFDPYQIMIAEFMLHRTRAEQVEPVYKNFIEKYPDVFILSEKSYEEISEVTKHLGLHWRSVHFVDSARYIRDRLSGKIPDDRCELLKIPGVGDYVAGAILTVCYNKNEHVIDSNIARFLNRYYGLNLSGEIRRKREIIEKSKILFQYDDTRNLLFCLLDFTALICKPTVPECEACIFNDECKYVNYL